MFQARKIILRILSQDQLYLTLNSKQNYYLSICNLNKEIMINHKNTKHLLHPMVLCLKSCKDRKTYLATKYVKWFQSQLVQRVIKKFRDDQFSGHSGINKTINFGGKIWNKKLQNISRNVSFVKKLNVIDHINVLHQTLLLKKYLFKK